MPNTNAPALRPVPEQPVAGVAVKQRPLPTSQRRVTEVDTSRQESAHRFPYILPDGCRFLFTVRSDLLATICWKEMTTFRRSLRINLIAHPNRSTSTHLFPAALQPLQLSSETSSCYPRRH